MGRRPVRNTEQIMRFLKPLLVGATLVAFAAPALASAEPFYGDGGRDYHRDAGDHGRWDGRRDWRRADRGADNYRRHDYWGRRDYGYGDRSHWRHHRWEDQRGW
jgi:hypothetical protein